MSEIKVGDRVKAPVYGRATVIGEHIAFGGKRWLWIEYDSGHECYGVQATQLTRIEPVVLTPKYSVGSKVRLKEEHTTATHIVEIQGVSVAYTFENWATRLEKDLEPVCLHCKGTGVSE